MKMRDSIMTNHQVTLLIFEIVLKPYIRCNAEAGELRICAGGDAEEYDEEYDETFEAYEAAQKAPVLSAEQQTKSNLETLAKQDPKEFAKLLRTWISED